jgi:hypothetical protein
MILRLLLPSKAGPHGQGARERIWYRYLIHSRARGLTLIFLSTRGQ